jgi:hypothetical protein
MADQIMSHKEWMKLTDGGKTSIRSPTLRSLDSALEKYHRQPDQAHYIALHKAMAAWIEATPHWKTSVRNAHHAVETLRQQLRGQAAGAASGAGVQAMKDEAHQVMLHIFRGAQITWKNEFAGKLASELANPDSKNFVTKVAFRQYKTSAANNKWGTALNSAGVAIGSTSLHSMSTGAGSGAISGTISKLVSQVVPSVAQREVLSAVQVLVPSFQAQFTAAVMPLGGILVAAGATLWNTGSAAAKQYGIVQTRTHRDRSLAGVEAKHAIAAMIRILERERNADIFAASVSVAELGGKIAGLAIDGGMASNTAIGLASNIAKLLNIVRTVYRDVSEKNAANKLLFSGRVDLKIFETCPLLGAYLVCCLPTSALMALILDRFGEAGWMDAAERTASHHLDPLREKARAVINEHRFEIRTLRRFPGAVGVNKAELERMAANVGKSKYEGIAGPEVVRARS